jgi:mono/diheme cytochrome c family protein
VGGIDPCAAEERRTSNFGEQLFLQSCASCHGIDGRGAGPAAAALKTGPADLTQISRTHGGKFPFLWVAGFIDGERNVAAHGSREMPVWGKEFRWRTGEYGARSQIYALTQYIESIQEQ